MLTTMRERGVGRGWPWRRRLLPLLAILMGAAVAPGAPRWGDLARQPDTWYAGDEGRRMTANVLSWQAATGSWPKNGDTVAQPFTGARDKLQGTFDNGATRDELRFLARACVATGAPAVREAFLRGLDHILQAQYPIGGWPQFYPPGRQYHRHITFNDNTMVGVLELLREVAVRPAYAFVDAERRRAAQAAFDRGVACILRCQVTVNGRLTAWCAQHDAVDCSPRPARAYELVSLSGGESAGILGLLMSLDAPPPAVRRAIDAGAAWYAASALAGIRIRSVDGDRVVEPDPQGRPLWARFYEIETNRPFFCGRDGVKKYTLAEIERERRGGYAWYGNWGERVARDYADWLKKWPPAVSP